MADLLFLASVLLPAFTIVAGALLAVVMPRTPHRAPASAPGHSHASAA